MRHTEAALVLAALSFGCTHNPPSETALPAEAQTGREDPGLGTAHGPFKEGILLSDSTLSLDNGVTSTNFNFAHLRELHVRIGMTGVPHVGRLNLVLYDPKGIIAYETSAHYSPDKLVRETNVPGAMRPITVFRAKPHPQGGFALDYVIPVSGTMISRYMSPGTWKIDALIDGRPTYSTNIDVSTTY
jgi:hypothetical protein